MVDTEVGQVGLVGAGEVGDQGVDGVLGVLFVGADHPTRAALDPAHDVLIATAVDSSVGVRNGPALIVERQPGRGNAAVADRADHQLHGQLLTRPGVLGHYPPAVVADQLV